MASSWPTYHAGPRDITLYYSSPKGLGAILNHVWVPKAKLGAVSFGGYFQMQYSQSCSDFLPHSMGISQAQFQMVFKR